MKYSAADFHICARKYQWDQFDPINWHLLNYDYGSPFTKYDSLDRCMVVIGDAPNIDIHPTFAKQLGIQVSREMERILGIKDLQKWYVTICPFGCGKFIKDFNGKPIDKDGYSNFYIRVEGKNMLHSNTLWIRWKSLKKDIPYIALNDEVSADTIQFEICEGYGPLPSVWPYEPENVNQWTQTLPKELYPLKKRKKSKTGFRFDVEIYSPDWPNVILQMVFDKALKENILGCIQEFINKWNDESEAKKRDQIIHYADVTDSKEDLQIEVFIDFGSCKPIKSLDKLFEWLNGSEIPINHIIVK